MTPIEKLAREICWAGFANLPAKQRGTTKAKYWAKIMPDARGAYMRDAKHFVWLLHTLPLAVLNVAHDIEP